MTRAIIPALAGAADGKRYVPALPDFKNQRVNSPRHDGEHDTDVEAV